MTTIVRYVPNKKWAGLIDDVISLGGAYKNEGKGGGGLKGFGIQLVGSYYIYVDYSCKCKTGCKSMHFEIWNTWSNKSATKDPGSDESFAGGGNQVTTVIVGDVSNCE